jgi:glycosyltransferase involved in cell wall biosynthesis
MSHNKVSVIVPVYNASKYLRPCLDSILCQTLSEFELICVDDGSTDDSPAILKEYEASDSRVHILTQTNQYAGTARNAGKAIATGEYLVFWDADDFFKPDALEVMYNKCIEDQADICICSVSHYFEDLQKLLPSSGYIKKSLVPKELPFSQKDVPDHILNITTAHPWNKMFRREYIESIGLDFHTTRNGNDIFFVINAIARAERITVVNKALICYRVNQADSLFGSLTSSPLTPINNWIATRESLIAHNAFPKRSFDNKILNTLVYFLHNLTSWNSFLETYSFLQNEGLDKLGLTEQEDGYYYSASNGECLRHMLHDTPEDFITFFMNQTYHQNTELTGKNQQLTQRHRRLKRKCARQEKELLNAGTRLEATLAAADTALQEERRKCDTLRESAAYRIGRAFTYLPRKVFYAFKENPQ